MMFNAFMTTHKTSLKQLAHDLTSSIIEAQSTVEELKMFLEVDNLEEIKKKLDKFYMVT